MDPQTLQPQRIHFLYVVTFEYTGDLLQTPRPIVASPEDARRSNSTRPHRLDRDLVPCLPCIWYCLHLPRTNMDLYRATPAYLRAQQGPLAHGHRIVLEPLASLRERTRDWAEQWGIPALLVATTPVVREVRAEADRLGFVLGTFAADQISDQALRQHWDALQSRYVDCPGQQRTPGLTERLDTAACTLPVAFAARHFETTNVVDPSDPAPAQVRTAFFFHAYLAAREASDESRDDLEAPGRSLGTYLEEKTEQLTVPLVIASPGAPVAYQGSGPFGDKLARPAAWALDEPAHTLSNLASQQEDPVAERAAIESVVTHRAIAQNGVGLILPGVDAGLFRTLAELERHCAGPMPSPKPVRRWLSAIGRALGTAIGKERAALLTRGSPLIAFTDFPIGLAILPGDESPLCCRVPVVYRTLTPLTGTLQRELIHSPSPLQTHGRLRILVAECISRDDPVGMRSRQIWAEVAQSYAGHAPLDLKLCEAPSVVELGAAVSSYQPNVLILSAHGFFAERWNTSGLQIGSEFVYELDLRPPPPLVILSSCHNAPRGRGVINPADILVRRGTYAVISTQIPVDVTHNAVYIARFLLRLADRYRDERTPTTIAHLWHHTLRAHAVEDLALSNRQVDRLLHGPERGSHIWEEYEQERRGGRIRSGHLYGDTEDFLIEAADRAGEGNAVREWLRSWGYIPESLFYCMHGWPERLIVGPPAEAPPAG